jgi:hypothetical protein
LFKVALALYEVKFKPCPADKRAVCTWCGADLVAAIAITELHIATLYTDDHPLREEMIIKYAGSSLKTAPKAAIQQP